MPTDTSVNRICPKCKKNVKSQLVTCGLCKLNYHLNCSPVSKPNSKLWVSWTCENCITLFPFSDQEDVTSCLPPNNISNIISFENMIFNPFDLDIATKTNLSDVDPDANSIQGLKEPCRYYNENQFEHLIKRLPSDQILSAFHLNIRSLPKNYDHLSQLLSSMNHNFSIIALTETWLSEDTINLYELPLYNSLHLTRKHKSGGGVVLYIRNDYDYVQRADLSVNFQGTDTESIFIELTQSKNGRKIIIGCIYRPPDSDLNNFNNSMASALDRITREGKMCYILGDYNINLFKSETHSSTQDFLNNLYSNYFYPIIHKPTRVTDRSATLIDNILTNSLNKVLQSGILYSDISDHFPIFQFTVFDEHKGTHFDIKRTYRKFNERNTASFKQLLSDLSWNNVYAQTNPNGAYQAFMESFNTAFNKCFPQITAKKALRQDFHKPWFTPGLHKSSKEKNKLYKKFLKNPTSHNQMSYKAYKNKFTHLLRSAKKKFFAEKFKESANNIKATWSIINQLLHKKKSMAKFPTYFSDSGKTFIDPLEIACKFNDFFANVGASLAKKINHPWTILMVVFPLLNILIVQRAVRFKT